MVIKVLTKILTFAGILSFGAAVAAQTSIEFGRDVYNYRCYFCHGFAGDGRTLAATYLTPPPRDFTQTPPSALSREQMIESVTHGRDGTAMAGFENTLSDQEIEAVVDFVRANFMAGDGSNIDYHSPPNGWSDSVENSPAYPFAKGLIPLDTADEALTEAERAGKQLFLSSCISCHDRAQVRDPGVYWEPAAVSYPRGGFKYGRQPSAQPDAISEATPFARHEIKPEMTNPTDAESRGETLFQENCAFCHGADGTGKNWIGSFMEPHARDLTDPQAMAGMTPARLRQVIKQGLPGTSMPAWDSVFSEAQINDVIAYISKVFYPLPVVSGSEK